MSLSVIVPVVIALISIVFAYRSVKRRVLTQGSANKAFDNVIFEIRVPKKIEEDINELKAAPIASEHMFASLHGLLKAAIGEQEQFSFEITSSNDGIRFYAAVPTAIKSFVESQIYAQYPQSIIKEVEDYTGRLNKDNKVVVGADVVLTKDYIFPIKTFKDFEVDPISAITSALSEVKDDEQIWLQLLVKPIPDTWQQEGHDYVKQVREGTLARHGGLLELLTGELKEIFFLTIKRVSTPAYADPSSYMNAKPGGAAPAPRLSAGQELELKAIENKLTKMGFESTIRVIAISGSREIGESRLRSLIASLRQFSTANLNGFTTPSVETSDDLVDRYKKRIFPDTGGYVLNVEELASVYHLPASTVETPTIAWAHAKRGEPPLNLPSENATLFGVTNFRNKQITFGIKDEDRLRHMYLIGKTGSGKSQTFRTMIMQDIANGKGVGVMDPHGTLIDEILEIIPENRLDDVVYFDPSDEDRPVALNMLEVLDPKQRNLMASGIVSAIKQHFGTISWGPRLEYLLNICILTLLEVDGTTMLGITRLLTDDNYRKFILHYVKDPVVKEFWDKEFKDMKSNPRLITEAVAPIQNKIGRFLSSSTIRNILGRPKSTVRIDDIMNTGKIFLINLSKGKIGDDNANLLGSLLVSRIQFVALQRASIPEKQRVPFYLFVDEFQNFASGSFESILSEARKYKLALHITHQYTSQLPEEVLNAVFGNVGTLISLALGAPDAEVLEREFSPVFTANDLISLERQQMYLKLMIDGMTSQPFSAFAIPRTEANYGNSEKAKDASRQKYGQDRAFVEDKIKLWVERKFDLGMAIADENKRKKDAETLTQPQTTPQSSNGALSTTPNSVEEAQIVQQQQTEIANSVLENPKPDHIEGEVVLERKE